MQEMKNKILIDGVSAAIFLSVVALFLSQSFAFAQGVVASSHHEMIVEMKNNGNYGRIGVVPRDRVIWIKNSLVTIIGIRDVKLRSDSIKLRFFLSYINPSDRDIKWTGMPMPEGPEMRLYVEGKEIPGASKKLSDVMPYMAAPRDDEIKANSSVLRARDKWTSDGPVEFVIPNSQLVPGTHIYEIVYWHSQLDWIDVREYLERTDSQGKGRMMYPITDNAPSNRLYFKIYKPTEEEAKQGRHIEFLGEVDAKTQGPQFPFARPGDFAPRTGYWQAVGKSIDAIGGYHETFVKEGDSMPNLSGKVGVDPFSFQWKFIGDQSAVSARMKRNQKIFHEDDSIDR